MTSDQIAGAMATKPNPPAQWRSLAEVKAELMRRAGFDNAVRRYGFTRSADVPLELVVADDGDGFDATAVSRRGRAGGWGLITMRERAEAIGGILTIESAPSRGTRLIVTIAS